MDAVVNLVVNSLDKFECFMHRLYWEKAPHQDGIHMKDLKSLNWKLGKMVVIDNNLQELDRKRMSRI